MLKSKKQEAFAQHYALHGKPSEAYRHAYEARRMKADTIAVKASELLKDGNIAHRVRQLQKVIAEKARETFNVDAAYLLNRLVEIDQMDVADILNDDGSVKAVNDWPQVWRTYISSMDLSEVWEGSGDERRVVGVLKKLKWPDKLKNLQMLGRHVDVQAFKDRVEHDLGESFVDKIHAARERARAAQEGGNKS